MTVLIAFASRHEATHEIAQAIAAALVTRGVATDLMRLTRENEDTAYAFDPCDYEAVVLGSAVYGGAWLAPAVRFAHECAPALADRPLWVFSSGPVEHPSARPLVARPPVLPPPVRRAGPVSHQVFAGRLEHDLLDLNERILEDRLPSGDEDDRDWAAVEEWAAGIADRLREPAPVMKG
jgi:menaquinone-dependent protoporphyrinogen oxidase